MTDEQYSDMQTKALEQLKYLFLINKEIKKHINRNFKRDMDV